MLLDACCSCAQGDQGASRCPALHRRCGLSGRGCLQAAASAHPYCSFRAAFAPPSSTGTVGGCAAGRGRWRRPRPVVGALPVWCLWLAACCTSSVTCNLHSARLASGLLVPATLARLPRMTASQPHLSSHTATLVSVHITFRGPALICSAAQRWRLTVRGPCAELRAVAIWVRCSHEANRLPQPLLTTIPHARPARLPAASQIPAGLEGSAWQHALSLAEQGFVTGEQRGAAGVQARALGLRCFWA